MAFILILTLMVQWFLGRRFFNRTTDHVIFRFKKNNLPFNLPPPPYKIYSPLLYTSGSKEKTNMSQLFNTDDETFSSENLWQYKPSDQVRWKTAELTCKTLICTLSHSFNPMTHSQHRIVLVSAERCLNSAVVIHCMITCIFLIVGKITSSSMQNHANKSE